MKFFVYLSLICCGLTLSAQTKKDITLEDIFKLGTFRSEAVSGFNSMKDGKHYSEINAENVLQKVRFEDGEVVDQLANFKELVYEQDTLSVVHYEFNSDETKLLLFTDMKPIYRRSILYKVYVYDLKSKELTQVHADRILHASFSPQSDKVAYVFENNLYYFDIKKDKTTAITKDGAYNILNGNCDWVYEEEFEFTKAYEWSQEGDYIAYYRFDQTEVKEFNFAIYDNLYPTDYKFKYPKAGEKNSVIEIHMYNLNNKEDINCQLGSNTDIYIPRIKINPFNNKLIIYQLNRLQNHLILWEANEQGELKSIYEERNKYFVEINDNIKFLKNKNAFVYTSEKDGYNHIYLHDIDQNRSTQLTQGAWEVAGLEGIDEKNELVYYASTEASPMERNITTISFDGKQKNVLTPKAGWNDAFFSEGFNYFMHKYSYLNEVPRYAICDKSGKELRMLKDNKKLKEKMKEYNLSQQQFMRIPNADGDLLNGWIIKPSNFDTNKAYPVLLYQYSGPGSQEVKNQFGGRDFWWYQMLAQKGYIIVCFDGTGTGFRGETFKKKTYLQLGKLESNDQIAVANHLAKLPYIDEKRIGIWGWSFGGYMSSICLLKAPTLFKTAIAVAPVTNWRYYDNIYTERYMRTPQENASGYDDNSPVNMVKNLAGNYLLIHGTADDNVHYQNSMMMVNELVKNNKDFDSEMYPNKNHGISGGNTRLQLYRKMTNFLLEKL